MKASFALLSWLAIGCVTFHRTLAVDPLTLWENYCVAEGVQLPNLYQTICVSSNDGPIVPKLLPADPNGVIYLKMQDNNKAAVVFEAPNQSVKFYTNHHVIVLSASTKKNCFEYRMAEGDWEPTDSMVPLEQCNDRSFIVY